MGRVWLRVVACILVGCLALPLVAEPKLPVVSVAYDGSIGSTESDEEILEDSSYRHEVALRIREDWSKSLVSTLAGDAVRKLYTSGSGASYLSIQAAPELRWSITDGVRLVAALLARRAHYDELDSDELPRDYTRLRASTGLTLGLAKGLTMAPSFQATYELYDNPLKSRQSYALALSLDLRAGGWAFGADYRGSARTYLGALSIVEDRLDHAFGVDITFDPNR